MPSRTLPLYHQLPVCPYKVSLAVVVPTFDTLSVLAAEMSGARKRASPVAFVLSMAMSSVLVLSIEWVVVVPTVQLVMVTLWRDAVSSWLASVAQSV